jgi:integrase/recombinase XerD
MATNLELRAPDPDDLRGLVLAWLSTRRSVHTRRAYARDLSAWLEFCAGRGVPVLTAEEHHAAMWARSMEAQGLAPSTVARKLSALSGWYTWLVRHGHAVVNPVTDLPRPVVDPDYSSTASLSKGQAVAFLDAADHARGPQRLRTAAIVAALIFTGCRVSELTGADVEDLGTDRGHRVLHVVRKGGARQALAVPAPAAARVDAYLAARGDTTCLPAVPSQEGSPRRHVLFATDSGRRMFPADVTRLLRSLGTAAGLPADLVTHLGPHALRHSYATLALNAGVSLRDLQDALGHKDPRTTRRYDRSRGLLDRSPGYDLAKYLAA